MAKLSYDATRLYPPLGVGVHWPFFPWGNYPKY